MDVMEKLVELLESARYWGSNTSEEIADNLLENGVTVQEWFSVEDRLPKDDEIVTICTEKGFVYAGELIGDTWFLDNDSWTENVTHWMPMPQPPKGE